MGIFPGGRGGGAGPRRVTASASVRPQAPEGGASFAGWPGLSKLVPTRGVGWAGLGPGGPCVLLEVGPSSWESAAQRRPRERPCGKCKPIFTFPVFGYLMVTEPSSASSRKSSGFSTPTSYVASRLLLCNDQFSCLSPSLSFVQSLTVSHLLNFRPWAHGRKGGRPGAALWELPF